MAGMEIERISIQNMTFRAPITGPVVGENKGDQDWR